MNIKLIIFLISILQLCVVQFYGIAQKIFDDEQIASTSSFYLDSIKLRAEKLLSVYDTIKSPNYIAAAVKYARNIDIETANKNFLYLLKEPRGDMFWMIAAMSAYLHGKERMSSDVRSAMQNAWKTYRPYRGDTENHWVMYYSALYLAAEQWMNLSGDEWYNGNSSIENLKEAKEFLLHWVKTTTSIGQGEFDSPDYIFVFLNAMILLNDFAKDPQIKKLGQMMIDYILADFAVEHLSGQYIGGFSRVYEPAVYEPARANCSGIAHLLFGAQTRSGVQSTEYLFALSSYRLPEIIFRIATDRSTPYIHKEKKRVRNVIRFGKEKNPPVYKYDYVTKDYAVGSLQGGILQPIQQHTWGVNFISHQSHSTIFGLHPYWSAYELGMFFPEEIKTMMADVVASKGTYNNPDKWTSSSPFERTLQYRNTLLVLYDIAPVTTTEHVDGFFPKNLDTLIRDTSGWIIAREGETYIGWYPLQPYQWIDEAKNFRLRSHKLQNGCVIEVRSKDEVHSFTKFISLLRSHKPHTRLVPGDVAIKYTNLSGDRLEFIFDTLRKVNGRIIELTRYKLFEGPYLNAHVGSGKLTMAYKKMKRVLDFKNWTITETVK